MTDHDPAEVPDALVRLMNADFDPTELSNDELVDAVARIRQSKKRTESVAAAELSRRGLSWRQIGKMLGVDHTTAFGWAQASRGVDDTP